jgi:two-component system, NarL family, sensor histidine kinase UhpB
MKAPIICSLFNEKCMLKITNTFSVLLLITFVFGNSFCQIPNTRDSLVMFMQTAPKDSNYVWAMNRYVRKLLNETTEYDKADSLIQIAAKMALPLNYPLGKYASTRNKATLHYYKTDYATALKYFQQGVDEAQKYKLAPSSIYEAMSNVATAQNHLNQYEESIKTSIKCIEVQEKYHLPMYASIYDGIAKSLKELKRPKEALAYIQKSIFISKERADYRGLAISNNVLGNLYDDLNQYKAALIGYKTALNNAQKANFLRGQTDYLLNIGRMYQELKQPQEAIKYIEQSLALSKKLDATTSLGLAKFNLAEIYKTLNNNELAEKNYKEALALARQQDDTEHITTYQQALSDFYAQNASYKQAYEKLVEINNQKDSLATTNSQKQTQELIAKYEAKNKEQQIKLLTQESLLKDQALIQSQIWLGLGILLLLLGAVVVAWLLNRAKYKRLAETQTLRSKIAADLHDEVGSMLSSISLLSGMSQQQLRNNQPQKVEKMIDKISQDAHQMLEAMDDIVWSINPRNDSIHHLISRLKEYAKPLAEAQSVRLSFDVDINTGKIILPLIVRQNLYLIIKEGLNNTFKYAKASDVDINCKLMSGHLNFIIKDNGIGFEVPAISSRNGLKNIKDRANAMKSDLKIVSDLGQGTHISLNIPIR